MRYKITNITSSAHPHGRRNIFVIEAGKLLEPGHMAYAARIEAATWRQAEGPNAILHIQEGSFDMPTVELPKPDADEPVSRPFRPAEFIPVADPPPAPPPARPPLAPLAEPEVVKVAEVVEAPVVVAPTPEEVASLGDESHATVSDVKFDDSETESSTPPPAPSPAPKSTKKRW